LSVKNVVNTILLSKCKHVLVYRAIMIKSTILQMRRLWLLCAVTNPFFVLHITNNKGNRGCYITCNMFLADLSLRDVSRNSGTHVRKRVKAEDWKQHQLSVIAEHCCLGYLLEPPSHLSWVCNQSAVTYMFPLSYGYNLYSQKCNKIQYAVSNYGCS
jgi:hypothetical protein